jgi:sec-independent protein translocase protein TatB
MFGIAWSELLLIGVVALVVIPPKDLPAMMRMVGKWVGQMRRMAYDFQYQVKDALREAELDDIRKSVTEIANMEEITEIQRDLEASTAPLTMMEGQMREDLSIEAGNKSFNIDTSAYRVSPDVEKSIASKSTLGPAHADFPNAMTAELEPLVAAEILPVSTSLLDLEPVAVAVERPRLPAHLRGPDPEPVAPEPVPHEPARVSGASS